MSSYQRGRLAATKPCISCGWGEELSYLYAKVLGSHRRPTCKHRLSPTTCTDTPDCARKSIAPAY
eukprot:scaffold1724_cov246-Pinguiococcus_pyrenoidosus.AAC.26